MLRDIGFGVSDLMQYFFAQGFQKSLKKFHPHEKIEIQRQVDSFMLAVNVCQIPYGLGLKKLRDTIWEFRVGLGTRILFQWNKDTIGFLFIGNHNEIQQYLKHFFS